MLPTVTVLLIYMIMAILYEHFAHPITILTVLPLAIFGALFMLLVFGQELNLFSFAGFVLLVGLVKKNSKALGIAVVGGLIFSQLLTLFITPAFFVSMEEFVGWLRKRSAGVLGQ